MLWNDLIGQRLGRYEIEEELGRGGSSRVYRAHVVGDGQDQAAHPEGAMQTTPEIVAVKVMPNDAEDRVGFVQRFAREVETVRKLSHPNIVKVFDAGETPEFVYLAMQCVTGGTLRQRLGNPLPANEAAAYVVKMAQALHHAHLLGIIHRDVKPSNMLVDGVDPQHLLLTDFGTAKIQGARGLTKTGTTIGTPEYMAPEQAEGHDIDQRADIYALGCVLYEELTGRPPFVGATAVSVLYQHVHSRPSYIRGFNPTVPRELAHILEICLAKRPEDRFGTAELLAEALLPFADGSAALTAAQWEPGMRSQPSRPTFPSHPAYPARAGEQAAPPMWPALGEGWRTPTSGKLTLAPAEAPPLSQPVGSDGLLVQSPAAFVRGLNAAVPAIESTMAGEGETAPILPAPILPAPILPASTPPAPPQRAPRQTIPLPNFRLPSKTGQLAQPFTPDERQELEALLAQLDQERLVPPGQQGQRLTGGPASIPPGMSAPLGRSATSGPLPTRGATSGPMGRSPTSGPLRSGATSGPLRSGPPSGPLRTSGAAPAVGAPVRVAERPGRIGVYLPPEDRSLPPTPPRGAVPWGRQAPLPRRRGPRLWTVALAAVVALLLVGLTGWLALGATGSGLGFLGHAQATATTQPTATSAPSPTATHAPQATATATTSPQHLLNQQAYASFRAVSLETGVDGGCANGRTYFNSGQTVYVNLCTSSSPLDGPMRVQVRQGGQVIYTLVYGQYLSPHASYWYYHTLPAGSYDMLVTITTSNGTGVARDIAFTIG